MTTKRKPAASRAPARKSAQAGKKKPVAPPPSILRAHAGDLWAIALITLGVLLALATWAAALGPVGHGVNTALADLVGWARAILPLLCVGAGVILLIERDRERPDPLRTGLGAGLGLVGICGLAELANGTPALGASKDLRNAGGWVGALVGHPLQAGLGTAGAAVVFVAVVIVAIIIATGIKLATCGRAVRQAGGAIGSLAASWWKGSPFEERTEPTSVPAPVASPPGFEAEALEPAEEEPPTEVTLFDGEHETAEPEPAPAVVTPAVLSRAAGNWKLPPLSLLPPTKQLRHDQRQV